MHRRFFLIGAAALAACSPAPQSRGSSKPGPATSAATTAAVDDPAAIIRPIYAPYLANNTDVSLPDLKDAAPWSASLREAIVAMEARSDQDESGEGLDFDPIVNAQDWQLSNFNVAAEGVVAQSHAVVRASFLNGGAQQDVMYDLIWESSGWRIDNMRSGGPPDGWDLRQLLSGK
ncbi:MAG: hypothetical protein HY054_11625 [Proteobacteria bacterium]|nr:hypothetical protein [Pseudomonadota bacterium]